jgi:hypothetical protein
MQAGIPIGPQDPRLPYQAPQAEADLAAKRTSTAKTAQDMQLDPRRLAIQERNAGIAAQDAATKQQQQALAQRQAQQERARTTAQWDEFGNIINSLTDQYNENFKGDGGSSRRGRFAEFVPGNILGYTTNDANDRFNSTAMRAGPFLKSVLFPGSKDTDAAAEYKQKIMPFLPQASDSDGKIADKIKQLRRIYEGQMRAVGAPLRNTNGSPPRKAPAVDPKAAAEADAILKRFGVK